MESGPQIPLFAPSTLGGQSPPRPTGPNWSQGEWDQSPVPPLGRTQRQGFPTGLLPLPQLPLRKVSPMANPLEAPQFQRKNPGSLGRPPLFCLGNLWPPYSNGKIFKSRAVRRFPQEPKARFLGLIYWGITGKKGPQGPRAKTGPQWTPFRQPKGLVFSQVPLKGNTRRPNGPKTAPRPASKDQFPFRFAPFIPCPGGIGYP